MNILYKSLLTTALVFKLAACNGLPAQPEDPHVTGTDTSVGDQSAQVISNDTDMASNHCETLILMEKIIYRGAIETLGFNHIPSSIKLLDTLKDIEIRKVNTGCNQSEVLHVTEADIVSRHCSILAEMHEAATERRVTALELDNTPTVIKMDDTLKSITYSQWSSNCN